MPWPPFSSRVCWSRRAALLFPVLSVLCALSVPVSAAECRWLSVLIVVSNLPPKATTVLVSCPVNFSDLLAATQTKGLVDEQSIRLLRHEPDGSHAEQTVQFTPDLQPRLKERQLAAGTSPSVSFIAEIPAGESPAGVRSAGQITWLANSDEQGRASYRLLFGVPTNGTMVQVPYAPHNFRAFNSSGKAAPVQHFPMMQLRPQWPAEGFVNVLEANKLVASYHTGPVGDRLASGALGYRRPFIYPLIGPDGVALTEFGKPHDPTGSHRHHYSLWIAHNSVNGEDFWSEKGGLIVHDGFEDLEDGPLFCRITQKTLWRKDTADLLRERRAVTFHAAQQHYRLIDIALEFTPAGDAPVTFGQTSFGFLAARVAQSMSPFDGGGEIVNSAGDRNEQRAHLKRARWLDQSGPVVPDRWGGVAILEHPDNPRSPTGWHCRNDGWAGAAFNMEEPFKLAPGHRLALRYRIVLHRWDAARGEVARRYEEFATRPSITIGKATIEPTR